MSKHPEKVKEWQRMVLHAVDLGKELEKIDQIIKKIYFYEDMDNYAARYEFGEIRSAARRIIKAVEHMEFNIPDG